MPRPKRDGSPAKAPNKRKLTDLFVANVKPADQAYVLWDTWQRGLGLAVQVTGNKSWKVVYHHGGRPRWYTIGHADAIGLADARQLAGEIMLRVARGEDPQASRRAERSAGTFQELAERYVNEHAKKRNKSWVQADALVRRYLLPRWGKLPAGSISRSDVKATLARIEARAVSNQTWASASAIFSWAIREEVGGVKTNPCHGVTRHETQSRERILSDSEIPRFWAEFDPALKLVLLLGQRPGEVTHMRREHVADGWWTLPGDPVPELDWPGTKNGASHRIWLPEPALALVDEFLDGGRGHPMDAKMRRICLKLGVERATPHDLRRTFSSKVTALGFGRDAMNRVTNHKEGGIADVYDRHEYADENRRVMETVAKRIVALAEGGGGGDNVVVPLTPRRTRQ
jgi:integrase